MRCVKNYNPIALACFTVAMALHALALSDLNGTEYFLDESSSLRTRDALTAMLVMAFLAYIGSAFISFLIHLGGASENCNRILVIMAGIGGCLGGVFTLAGLAIHGHDYEEHRDDSIIYNVYEWDAHNPFAYIITLYVVGMISAVAGGIIHLVSLCVNGGPSVAALE